MVFHLLYVVICTDCTSRYIVAELRLDTADFYFRLCFKRVLILDEAQLISTWV